MFNRLKVGLSRDPEQKQNLTQRTTSLEIEAEPFTLVTAAIHRTIRDNSLYWLINDLQCENESGTETKENTESAELLHAYRVEHHIDADGHACWFIYLNAPLENDLFSKLGFQLKEFPHVRVDKEFANDNTKKAKYGLAACHFTEQHSHPVTLDERVVHGYIGSNARFISCQIKEYKPGVDSTGKQIETENKELHELVQKNSQGVVTLIEKLVHEKNKRYQNAVDKSYEIEAELEKILFKILTDDLEAKDRLALAEQYRTLADAFLEKIRQINCYNDQEVDKRDERLFEILQYMNAAKNTSADTEASENGQNEDTSESSLEVAATQTEPLQESLFLQERKRKEEALAQKRMMLLTEIQRLAVELEKLLNNTSQDVPNLVSLQAIKLELHPKLVELAFFPGITKEEKIFLREITTRMNQTVTLIDGFKEAIELGNLDHVIQLYPHVQDENLYPIFFNFILNILIESPEVQLPNLIKIAEFFYDNSNKYCKTIEMMDGCLFAYQLASLRLQFSLLFRAFIFQNYSVFSLFLRQACNPNRIGFAYQGVAASLLNVIVYYTAKPTASLKNFSYIEALLEAGAFLDLKTHSLTLNLNEGPVLQQKMVRKLIKHAQKTRKRVNLLSLVGSQGIDSNDENLAAFQFMKKTFERYHSTLEIVCYLNKSPSIELLTLLVPKSNLSGLIGGCVLLANQGEIKTRFIMGTMGCYIVACGSIEEANQVTNNLDMAAEHKSMSLLIYHTDPREAGLWLPCMNLLAMALCEKHHQILEAYPEQVAQLYDNLLKKAEPFKKSTVGSEIIEYLHYCRSVLYLLLLNQDASFDQAQKMVQTLCFIGQAYSRDRIHDNMSNTRAIGNFGPAFFYCLQSRYAEALQKTDFFNFTKRRLTELGVNTEQLENKLSAAPSTATSSNTVSPITTAAVMHFRRDPSLMAAHVQTIPELPVTLEVEQAGKPNKKAAKGKKKKH